MYINTFKTAHYFLKSIFICIYYTSVQHIVVTHKFKLIKSKLSKNYFVIEYNSTAMRIKAFENILWFMY